MTLLCLSLLLGVISVYSTALAFPCFFVSVLSLRSSLYFLFLGCVLCALPFWVDSLFLWVFLVFWVLFFSSPSMCFFSLFLLRFPPSVRLDFAWVFSSVSPSNPPAFLPLCAGFFFSIPPMIFGSIPLPKSPPFSRPFSGFYKAREGLVSLPPQMVGIVEAVEARDYHRIVGIVAMICWILLDFPLLNRSLANRWWTVGSKTTSFGMENDKL